MYKYNMIYINYRLIFGRSSMDINYQIIDSITASIYWKDTKGVYIGCNKYMVAMAGLDNRKQIIGKTDFDLPWKDQAEKISRVDKLVISNNKTYKLEESPKIHQGVAKTFLSSKTPLINDEGKIIGIIGVSIDITEKKDIEHILELTQQHLEKTLTVKERFLKNLNHETRNPLSAFVSTAEVLAERWEAFDDQQKHKSIITIANSARRLSNFVNNTFDLANFVNDEVELKLERNNINDLIEESVKSFNNKATYDNNAHIEVKSAKNYFLIFDLEKIKQVIDNLLSNALKWTQPSEVISIEIWQNSAFNSNSPGLHCKIVNKGIGIAEDELEFIFEPFTESSNTASQACGTGLGLTLCREIIKAHGGKIWAESKKSKNNISEVSFHFIIPTNLVETG